MNKIVEGQQIPDFEILLSENNSIHFSSLRNKNVVLYFYPKDNTPGCTLEAKDFAAYYDEFLNLNTEVIGVSKDDFKSHNEFARECKLSFPLAYDKDGSICGLFGVWCEKSMMGKKYFGIERTTLLIDSEQKVRKIWHNVSVNGHVENVLREVNKLYNK